MVNSSNPQKTIVVLGIARSGTSITTALLNVLGVKIGNRLTTKNRFNPKGAFEDVDFMNLEGKIFEAAKVNYWHSPSREKILSQGKKFDDEIRKLISKKSEKNKIWGWKSPHSVLTIELFLPYITNPHFIVVSRNPLGTAKSILERRKKEYNEDFDLTKALKLVTNYDKIVIDFLEKYPDTSRIFLSFEDIIASPIKQIEKLGQFLGIEVKEEQRESVKEVIIPRGKIEKEKRLIALVEVPRISLIRYGNRVIRFARKCVKNPSKTPHYIYAAFKKNLKI